MSEFEAILLWAALAFFLYRIEDIKLERTHAPYFWLSLAQGHALWHVLGAVSMWCFYKYFRTEIDNY